MEIPATIAPPFADELLKSRLEAKLREYEDRVLGKGRDWEFTHPDLALKTYPEYRSARFKADVLSAVLKSDSPVNVKELSEEMSGKYGESFFPEQFANACAVIAYYCGHEVGEMISGGTGLPHITHPAA